MDSTHSLNTNTIKRALHKAVPLKYLDEQQLLSFLPFCDYHEFPKGKTLLQQGKPGFGLYIIIEGEASVEVNMLGKGTIRLATLKRGDFFGEVVLLQSSLCTATVKSLKKTTCLFLSSLCFEVILKVLPAIHSSINQAIIEGVIERQSLMSKSIKQLIKKINSKSSGSLTTSKNIKKHLAGNKRRFNKKEIFDLFNELSIFKSLSSEDIHDLIAHSKIIKTHWYQNLLVQDQINKHAYFILDGSVQITAKADRREYKVLVFGPNTLILPNSFLRYKHDVFEYKSNDPAHLLQIPIDYFNQLKVDNDQAWIHYFNLYCQMIVSLQNPINHLMIRLTNERIESIIRS